MLLRFWTKSSHLFVVHASDGARERESEQEEKLLREYKNSKDRFSINRQWNLFKEFKIGKGHKRKKIIYCVKVGKY